MNDFLPLTIENAKKNKEALLALLGGGSEVSLDVSPFEAVDLSGLQTLVAFMREATARGKKIVFTGTVQGGFSRALTVSGLASEACATAEDAEAAIKAVCR